MPVDENSPVDFLLRRQSAMEGQRVNFDVLWRQIAERILPRQSVFQRSQLGIIQGEKRTELIFDATASLALERFAAAMESLLTPRIQRWHSLKAQSPQLRENVNVKRYLDDVTDILFAARYSPRANFASQMGEGYIGLGAFGTDPIFIDDAAGENLRYKACHLSECFIAENHVGLIDTVHRKFIMTARQMGERFVNDKLPDRVKQLAKDKPETELEVLHCVFPRKDVDSNRRDYRGMAWRSCYIALADKSLVEDGGYRTMPYAVGRYVTGPREIYGRSPAMTVLPDIKTLQEISKTVLRAAQKVVDPPLLLQEDGALQSFDLRAGALNYGGVNEQGQQLVHPLVTGGRIDLGEEQAETRRKFINDAFLVTLFQILVDNPQMTATEAMLRAQEKGALLAPAMARQQSELLGPIIERELDILSAAGQLPPMPPELAEAGGLVQVEYESPLNLMMRAGEAAGILQTISAVAPFAQADPSVMDVFNGPAIARELAEINGVPARLIRSEDEVAQMAAAKAQQQQAAALLQAAPIAASAAKDFTAAAQNATSIPQPQPQQTPAGQ